MDKMCDLEEELQKVELLADYQTAVQTMPGGYIRPMDEQETVQIETKQLN